MIILGLSSGQCQIIRRPRNNHLRIIFKRHRNHQDTCSTDMFSGGKELRHKSCFQTKCRIRRSAVDASVLLVISKLPGVDRDYHFFHQRKAIGNRPLNLQADNKPRTLRFSGFQLRYKIMRTSCCLSVRLTTKFVFRSSTTLTTTNYNIVTLLVF